MTAIRRDDDSTTITVSSTDAILFRIGLRVAPVFSMLLLGVISWYLARQEKDHDMITSLEPRVHFIERTLHIAYVPAPAATKSFINTSDVARDLDKSQETIRRYIKEGMLFPPPRMIKGQYVWDEPPTLLCPDPKQETALANPP